MDIKKAIRILEEGIEQADEPEAQIMRQALAEIKAPAAIEQGRAPAASERGQGNWQDFQNQAVNILEKDLIQMEARVAHANAMLVHEENEDWFGHFCSGAVFGAAQILLNQPEVRIQKTPAAPERE